MKNSNISLVENGRAKYAFTQVEKLLSSYPNKQSDITSYIKRLPVMIKTNGLGQALAFYYSKEKEHKAIYRAIAGWFSNENNYSLITFQGEFIEEITVMNRDTYRFVTNEVIALLNWMRRFADGYKNGRDGS